MVYFVSEMEDPVPAQHPAAFCSDWQQSLISHPATFFWLESSCCKGDLHTIPGTGPKLPAILIKARLQRFKHNLLSFSVPAEHSDVFESLLLTLEA